jgi:hypothetical protein
MAIPLSDERPNRFYGIPYCTFIVVRVFAGYVETAVCDLTDLMSAGES